MLCRFLRSEHQAQDAQIELLWKCSPVTPSLADLTKAMGINRPFRKALDGYADGPAAYAREALKEPTACAVVERLLRGALDMLTDPHHPRGCLWVQGALTCGESADPVRQELTSRREAGEAALRNRLQSAKAEGDLPPDSKPAGLARFIVTGG